MTAVRLTGISKSYGPAGRQGTPVLSDVDLQIEKGELVGLLGSSGSGKSTLLKILAGLDNPGAGSISIGSRVVADVGKGILLPPEKRRLGMVFQSYALWPHMTVEQNVAFPIRRLKLSRSEKAAKVSAALERVNLEGLGGRYPHELSGGQQQRVGIARATVSTPEVLLFDEPLSNLDASLRRRLMWQIRAVHEALGCASLYVSHDISELEAICDRIAVLDRGHIVANAAPEEILFSPPGPQVAHLAGFDLVLDEKTGHFFAPSEYQEAHGTAVRSKGIMPRELLSAGEAVGEGIVRSISRPNAFHGLTVELPGGRSVVARVPAQVGLGYQVGDRVEIAVAHHDTVNF